MFEYLGLMILLIGCWLLQIMMSYLQHKNYQKVINENKHRSSGFLGVGVSKAKYNLGKGVVLIVVTDESDNILDFREMSGVTVFSRFKVKKEFIGKKTSEIINEIKNKRRVQALEQALAFINNEKTK